MGEVKEPARIKYMKKMLELVERDLVDNQSMMTRAEVNIRKLKEERVQLIMALCELESELEVEEVPSPKLFADGVQIALLKNFGEDC